MADGLSLMRGFIARGYTPAQAAALVGHAAQESGLNPSSVNQKEDAHGLLQFRGSRWQALQDMAQSQGKSPNDPEVQMDYIKSEMGGSEKKSSQGFLNSTDVNGASAALRPYIRFGDNSDGTRNMNAVGFLNQYNQSDPTSGVPQMPQDPTSPVDPTQTMAAVNNAPTSLAAPPAQVGQLAGLAQSLKGVGQAFGPQAGQPGQAAQPAAQPQQPQFLAPQQIQMAQPHTQAQQIAQLIAKQYGYS